ncbi:MAG: hypothetical protein Q7U13_08110 [Rhodoferax sp.]|nr:hypothetical protein [Rhodoferax sp.]
MVTVSKRITTANPVKAADRSVAPQAATSTAARVVVPKTAAKVIAKPETKKSPSVAKKPAKPLAKPRVEKPTKAKKPKLVRDSFTIPKVEYIALYELKQRAGKLEAPAKKSELLRAGIKALATMSDAGFLAALKAVPAIKTGRPAKN